LYAFRWSHKIIPPPNRRNRMTGEEIVTEIRDATEQFGKCGKFGGAATVEIVKHGLSKEGISTSARDVFIKGVPLEIDLLVPRRGRSHP
jgi:hypothetical protein